MRKRNSSSLLVKMRNLIIMSIMVAIPIIYEYTVHCRPDWLSEGSILNSFCILFVVLLVLMGVKW